MVYLHFPGDFYLIFQLWHLFKDLGRVAIDALGILLVCTSGGGTESPSVKSCLLAWAQDLSLQITPCGIPDGHYVDRWRSADLAVKSQTECMNWHMEIVPSGAQLLRPTLGLGYQGTVRHG